MSATSFPPPPAPPGSGRVLVVDDDAANRKLLAGIIGSLGYEVVQAGGGEAALSILGGGHEVDLVLLDLMMPGVDGLAVLGALRQPVRFPVVVVTALEDRAARHAALEAGAVDFVTKPIDHVEVATKVRTLVELGRLRKRELASVRGRLEASERLLRLRFQQSAVGQVSWGRDLCVVAWNPTAARIFGWSEAEAMGQYMSFIVPEAARVHVASVWDQLMHGDSPVSTNQNVTRDGRTITCEWHNAPLRSPEGELIGVTSEVFDVTERLRLESALRQSQKMQAFGQLAGGIAHDFNNILSAILSFGDLALGDLPESGPRGDVEEMMKAAQRAAELTRQLLAFSRQRAMRPEPTDLSGRLVDLERLLLRTLGEHVKLEVVPGRAPIVVDIDPVQFDQVVLNLAVNARDAMPDGGQLCITLEVPPGSAQCCLVVADTGAGMDAATIERIFEPFFTTKPVSGGTGLGLATCFAVVEQAGGRIEVDSAPGEGTRFRVWLPLSCRLPGGAVDAPQRALPAVRARVLLVEDEEALRRVCARVLERAGYEVLLAADGAEGKRRLDEEGDRIDVVLTDLVMPQGGGLDVAAHAERVAPRAEVIMTTGYAERAVDGRLGKYPLLWKPVPPSHLVDAVAAAATRHRDRAGG